MREAGTKARGEVKEKERGSDAHFKNKVGGLGN